jgi:hypothetical protein
VVQRHAWRAQSLLDTVVSGETGVFFDRPEPEAIRHAIGGLDRRTWNESVLRAQAARFSEDRFVERLRAVVSGELVRAAAA